ncbi:MAG: hypothetical protein JO010_04225, partial [Alphaproteobacteria bacterium]|nr:hypothetical protein [Alphaproteobacteria bacterium]
MRPIALSLILSVLAAAASAAPPSCYRPGEIEADQAIRFQTELMVTSEVCKVSSYTDFTRRNREAIVAYQHALMDHFRRVGERNAEAMLDSYMTRLANELALSDGEQPAEALCARASVWLDTARGLGSADFRHIA